MAVAVSRRERLREAVLLTVATDNVPRGRRAAHHAQESARGLLPVVFAQVRVAAEHDEGRQWRRRRRDGRPTAPTPTPATATASSSTTMCAAVAVAVLFRLLPLLWLRQHTSAVVLFYQPLGVLVIAAVTVRQHLHPGAQSDDRKGPAQ